MDIVFPTCARQSSSAGTGSDCALNIAYNKQVPICSGIASENVTSDSERTSLKCRGWGDLCTGDGNFEFSFDPSSEVSPVVGRLHSTEQQYFTSIPFSTLFGGSASDPDLLLHVPGDPSIQLPFRPGDYNVDGFPDLLMTISNATASSGIFGGSKGTQAKIIHNVDCKNGVPGCEGKGRRGFQVGGGKGWKALDRLVDVVGASWVDVDDDVRDSPPSAQYQD